MKPARRQQFGQPAGPGRRAGGQLALAPWTLLFYTPRPVLAADRLVQVQRDLFQYATGPAGAESGSSAQLAAPVANEQPETRGETNRGTTGATNDLAIGTAPLGAWCLALALCVATSGCVQRRMTIRTNPPGAVVYVDEEEIGTSPCSHDFVYYGTRKIRLVKDGYETQTILQPFPWPWYELIGLDFVTENLIPGEIRDERVLDYQLQPQIIVPTDQLLGRAENLRRSSQPSVVQPAPRCR